MEERPAVDACRAGRGKGVVMAAVGRRWVRSFCPCCAKARNFTVDSDWAIRCPHCGYERGLRREPGTPRQRRSLVGV